MQLLGFLCESNLLSQELGAVSIVGSMFISKQRLRNGDSIGASTGGPRVYDLQSTHTTIEFSKALKVVPISLFRCPPVLAPDSVHRHQRWTAQALF